MPESPADGFLGRLSALEDQGHRNEILQQILDEGWDAGCWLRCDPSELVFGGSTQARQAFDAVNTKTFAGAVAQGDPRPNGLEQTLITSDEACWVVVTQQCDLLRDFRDEPFVELARTTFWGPSTPRPDEGTTRAERSAVRQWDGQLKQLGQRVRSLWVASSRFSPISPEVTEGGQWVVDLRDRILLPKDRLLAFRAEQALPANDAPHYCRDRFRRRLGDRYSRAALPERYMPVARWLREMTDDPFVNTMVREWVLRPPTESASAELHAIGLTQDELDSHEFDGDRWVTELSDKMPGDVRQLIDSDIRWASADVFPVATWDGAWRLDELESLSWLDPESAAFPPG